MTDRQKQGCGVAALIVATIVAIVLVANIAPYDQHACPEAVLTIASCLLTARETLSAGLIAAGGALFAAWLAWSAVRDQIKFEMARDASRQEAAERSRKHLAEIEIVGLKLTQKHIEKILHSFRGIDASSEWNYVGDLKKLAKTGGLSYFSQPLPSPFAGTMGHLSNKLVQLASQIEQAENDPKLRNVTAPAAVTSELRNTLIAIDRAIKETLDEVEAFRNELISAIAERANIIGGTMS